MLKVGVIGFGYWGPNVVRNFISDPQTCVEMIGDADPVALARARQLYPHLKLTDDSQDIIGNPHIDAVAIITPVATHFNLARRALENGKHIFIEKPLTATVAEAEQLVALADNKGLTIMVDHTFIFTGAVRKIKELIDGDVLGRLFYFDSTRVSLGLFQQDVNVVWDLAPHDLSIIDYLIKNKPLRLSAQGVDHIGAGRENIAYITIHFADQFIAHINANWLSPVKIRLAMIGGEKKMLVWDDLAADEKIKVYDRGVSVANKEGIYNLLVDYRSGDMWAPRLDRQEALKREIAYFVQCIRERETPINDGRAGLRVVRLLTLADASIQNGGRTMIIPD